MANVSVYNMEGKEVGALELNDAVFGVEVNEHLVHLAVLFNAPTTMNNHYTSLVNHDMHAGGW